MQENNGFDISMIEKMDGFTIEPSPADWQAIYDRLHPNRKRRFIWWWLPLAGLMAVGGLVVVINKAGVTNPGEKIIKKHPQEKNAHAGPNTTSVATNPALSQEIPANMSFSAVIPGNSGENTISASAKTQITIAKQKQTASASPQDAITKAGRIQPLRNADVGKSDQLQLTQHGVTTKSDQLQSTRQAAITKSDQPQLTRQDATTKLNQSESIEGPANQKTEQVVQATAQYPAMTPENAIQQNPLSASPLNDSATLQRESADSLRKSFPAAAIPTKAKENKWKFSAYIATGPNYPTEPMDIGPRAMSANAPDYSPVGSGSSNTYKTFTDQRGWHTAAGIAASKNMGNKWTFTTGLGISSSGWTTSVETFKDSIFNGARFTDKLGVETRRQKLWMAEIPLQFSNRIAGKKQGTLWWTIGLNNQFTLRSTQSSDSIASTATADLRLLNSDTRFYQPQFRFGLIYNYSGKLHWQLQPMAQYGLTSVYKNATGNNPNLLQLRLQFNLYLQGKKEHVVSNQ